MALSVENMCNQLIKHRLLEQATVRSLRQRWSNEAGKSKDDPDRFSKWLVSTRWITEFQLNMVTKGAGDQLRFNDYLLLDRIGRGRMAGVYKAVHHKLGQIVAIKVLPPSKAGHAQTLARFQREARLAVRLNHPNIVRTFQPGTTRGGLHFIVMEFLDGETMEDVLKRRKKLPIGEAVFVTIQALEGLQHLFDEDMIHRDMKPANLMLIPGTKPGKPDTTLRSQVKILDIGLGRALFDEGVPDQRDYSDLTAEGSLLGTPNYMAPEQARNPHGADIRADIYSVGCVLYEFITGEAPFADANFMKAIVRHSTEEHRPLREIVPDVPPELDKIISHMLEKDPAQRCAVPEQAANALKALPNISSAQAPSAEDDPTMKSYLQWLKTGADVDLEEGAKPSAAAPKERAASDKSPPVVKKIAVDEKPPAPIPMASAPSGDIPTASVKQKAPDAKPPSPAAPLAKAPVASGASKHPPPSTARQRSSPPVGKPVSAGSVPLARAKADAAAKPQKKKAKANGSLTTEKPQAQSRVRARDWIAAGIGAAAILVIEGIVWLILKILGLI